MDQGSVEYEVCPTLLHMASTGNRTSDLLILSNVLSTWPHAPLLSPLLSPHCFPVPSSLSSLSVCFSLSLSHSLSLPPTASQDYGYFIISQTAGKHSLRMCAKVTQQFCSEDGRYKLTSSGVTITLTTARFYSFVTTEYIKLASLMFRAIVIVIGFPIYFQ